MGGRGSGRRVVHFVMVFKEIYIYLSEIAGSAPTPRDLVRVCNRTGPVEPLSPSPPLSSFFPLVVNSKWQR